jgi:BirA family biotin operon repressor/biotin-[acetyl-CoA-carboxylase] ligase
MALSAGIHEAISEFVPDIKIKWPNDFMHDQRGKIGGMLIENSISSHGIESSVVGLGLNVNQIGFPFPNAVSLAMLAGTELDIDEVFRSLITQIEKWYLKLKRGSLDEIKDYYLHFLYRFDVWAWYQDEKALFWGKITGIDPMGNLLVMKQNDRVHSYGFKEIKFV